MSTMFKAGDFFVRLRVQGDRPKLTVWNTKGTKIVSEFISSATESFWTKIAELTSQEVVDRVQALLESEQ
ncbi:MAG TPA: hypothetical protein GX014_02785 [Firmicutes bacterium]|jgi:hypothetical protein|nr:hypothetical protein [Bacillota bacterium]